MFINVIFDFVIDRHPVKSCSILSCSFFVYLSRDKQGRPIVEPSQFISSGIGAVVGFALAQLVNLAKLSWNFRVAPRLKIGSSSAIKLLSHSVEVNRGEFLKEEKFGFEVRNIGRRIATGVRFQLLKIEYKEEAWPEYAVSSDRVFNLAVYNESSERPGPLEITLVPNARITVELASWREDYDVLFPSVPALPPYYEEICSGANHFRFTVVALDDSARFTEAVFTISNPGG